MSDLPMAGGNRRVDQVPTADFTEGLGSLDT
jgi:hypothetical protein